MSLAALATATAPVQAAAQPAFLAAAQMPPLSTPWSATQVFTGVPENGGVLCAPYKIPAQNTRYREFSTELDTNGVQVTTLATRRCRAHRSAGGDHFLAFTSIACTLICYRRLAT